MLTAVAERIGCLQLYVWVMGEGGSVIRFSRSFVSGQRVEGCGVDIHVEKLGGGAVLRGKGVEKGGMAISQVERSWLWIVRCAG